MNMKITYPGPPRPPRIGVAGWFLIALIVIGIVCLARQGT